MTMTYEKMILATREHFAQIHVDCIIGASEGEFFVNDLMSYIAWQFGMLRATERGDYDHTFTFLQFAHFLETEDCIALLP